MTVLEQLTQLKNQGMSDLDAIKILREQGIPPAEITEAFSRVQIKNAVENEETQANIGGMQHSILSSGEDEPERLPLEGLEGGTLSDADLTPPVPGGFSRPMPAYATKEITEETEIYHPQEAYSQYQAPAPEGYGYAPSAGMMDTDTIIEISEQVFAEKNRPLQKKIEEMHEFKVLAQANIEHMSDRLRKIESVIDRLQATILEKVGGYGQGIESIKKEMTMMQDSFGKIVNRVADSSERHEHHHSHQGHHQAQQTHHQTTQHHHTHPVTVHHSVKKTTRKAKR